MNAVKSNKRWNKIEYLKALDLYFKIKQSDNKSLTPSNISIQHLANQLGRSAGSLSMRLLNFQYLDTGSGLSNGGEECRRIWEEYSLKPEKMRQELSESGILTSDCELTDTNECQETGIAPSCEVITIDQAVNIVTRLGIELNYNYFELFSVLLDINKLSGKKIWEAQQIFNMAEKIHAMPSGTISQLDLIAQELLSEEKATELSKILHIFTSK